MKKWTLTAFCLILSIGAVLAQSKVTGTVISADDGQPIIGATALVKGTTIGAVTDLDGNFKLTVPESAKSITVSFIGMQTQELAIKPSMRVVLKSADNQLNEVVVTAMGVSREKKALGYAVQDIKSEQITQGANNNLAGALQGKVSGMEIKPSSGMPGASSQITIRGARSFTGDNTPLYVIDGMPVSSASDISTGNSVTGTDYANRAIDIDPNDIESINVLKGQAASALYGIRASNGVIIITTKSGKGLAKGKPQISVSSNLSFDKISRYPELQQTYAQGVYDSKTNKSIYSPNASTSWGPAISELPNDPTYGGNVGNALNNFNPANTQGKYYVPQRANAGLDPWVTPNVYNNIKDFFNTGVTFSNSVNVAQATESSNYSFTLGNSNQTGIVPTTSMDRYNAKFSTEVKLHNNWSTGFSGNYINSFISKMPTANDGLVATVYPAPASYDLAGIPSHYANNPYKQNTYRGTSGFDAAYWSIENNEFTEKTNRFFGNTFINYKTKFDTKNHDLNVKYQFGTDSYTTHYQNIWGYGHQNSDGEITNSGWSTNTFNSLLTANYKWVINSKWTVDALLGNEIVQNNNKYYEQYGARYNFPGWNHIENTSVQRSYETQSAQRTVGFFGNVGASYKNMLYFNVTGRNDYVSTMPRGNRSFFYPSISTGFVLTELDAFRNKFISFAKIRASYAEVGQAGRYLPNYYSTPSYGGGFYSMTPILYPVAGATAFTPYPNVYDDNLKPQNTRSYEVGFDLNFMKNIFGLNYTFSRQNVTDQIFSVPLAGSTGASSLVTNGGRIHTNAHEITLTARPISNKTIEWNMMFNWSKIDNYVDELAPGVESIMMGGFVTPQVRASKGEKFPTIYGTGFKRDSQGRILVDDNGLPMAGEAQVIGRVAPDFILGFNNSIRIKKLNISAVFDWKKGGQMYSGTNNLLDYYGVSKKTENREGTTIFDGYKADGTKNDIPITGAGAHQNLYTVLNNIDEAAIYDNGFIKLREVAVSYPVLKKKNIEVHANVFARNILIWSEIDNIDPESSQGNNNMAGAFERFSLPAASSYGFGFNIKF